MRAVQRTGELDRIRALRSRDQQEHADLRDALSAMLTRPHTCGPDCCRFQSGQVLRLTEIQAVALADAHDHRRLWFQGPMGVGKTLVTALLPRVLGIKNALLFVPAALRVKTVREFKKYAEHWDIWMPDIETYHRLSNKTFADYLESRAPKLIILDEGHSCKNRRGPRARRIRRYVEAHPDVIVVDVSGTGIKRHLDDAAHRMRWVAGDAECPLPIHEGELQDWGFAIDEKVPDRSRLAPGALLVFGGDDTIEEARRGLGRRIFATPGFVRSADPGVDASLYIHGVEVELSPAEDAAFRLMRGDPKDKEATPGWVTPDGHPIADAVELWRHARELAVGFFYIWQPRPPFEWLSPRQDWCAAVREILANNRRQLDTELQVAEEVRRAIKEGAPHIALREYNAWHAVKDSFVPNTIPQWVGDTAVRAAAEWLASCPKDEPGIVWAEHRAFAERLAEVAGVPHFGRQGLDARGRAIEDYTGPCVAGIQSNGQGRNLQQWHRCWIASVSPTGTIVEQLLARHHRQGQAADAVEVWWPFSCREQLAGFVQASADAAMHRDLLDAPAKLCAADLDMPAFKKRGWAWRQQLHGPGG